MYFFLLHSGPSWEKSRVFRCGLWDILSKGQKNHRGGRKTPLPMGESVNLFPSLLIALFFPLSGNIEYWGCLLVGLAASTKTEMQDKIVKGAVTASVIPEKSFDLTIIVKAKTTI